MSGQGSLPARVGGGATTGRDQPCPEDLFNAVSKSCAP